MENRFDELAKSLAGGMSRREALRRFGAGLAAALLAPFALAKKGWGDSPNPCCEQLCETCAPPGGGNDHGKCVSECVHCLNDGGVFCCPEEGERFCILPTPLPTTCPGQTCPPPID